MIAPGRGALAALRFDNYCGPFPRGSVALRLTIGGRTVVRRLPDAHPPVCGSRSLPARLGVSIFVRR